MVLYQLFFDSCTIQKGAGLNIELRTGTELEGY